ncbi:MAG TPA: hypothetical protein VLA56_22670 [Pseudomonadales bacterium]|nr:hypothetical protein [Pseudomonadales bacterium]
MTIQDLGSIGELVAALATLATLATLVYLANQVKQAKRDFHESSQRARTEFTMAWGDRAAETQLG